MLVMYDQSHSTIGFWKANCSELWERLFGSPPENSTAELPPTSASSDGGNLELLPERYIIFHFTE
jgi:hypothetical protein